MKKIVWIILVSIIIAGGVWYIKKHSGPKIIPTTTTYKNSENGLTFTYPKTLTVTTSDDTTTLHHEIPFTHHDYCDFKGEGTTTIPTLSDFNVTIHIDNMGLVDAMHKESPYIPEENFVNGQVVPSPGFIDPVTIGSLAGYSLIEGAEGCGHTIYYFSLANDTTLVVVQDLVTVFSGAIDPNQTTQVLQVPGVISKENADKIFNSVISSLSIK